MKMRTIPKQDCERQQKERRRTVKKVVEEFYNEKMRVRDRFSQIKRRLG